MSESIKAAMRRICDTLAANIANFAKFYDTPLNSHTTYGTYMIETLTDEYTKAFQALLKLKNMECVINECDVECDDNENSQHDSELILEKSYEQV